MLSCDDDNGNSSNSSNSYSTTATNDTYRTLTKTEGKWFCLLLSVDLYVLFVLFSSSVRFPLSIILKSTLNQIVWIVFLCVFEFECIKCFEILLSAVFFAAFLWHFFHHNFLSDHFRLRFHRFYCFVCVSTVCFFFILYILFICYDFTFNVFIFNFSPSLSVALSHVALQ